MFASQMGSMAPTGKAFLRLKIGKAISTYNDVIRRTSPVEWDSSTKSAAAIVETVHSERSSSQRHYKYKTTQK